MADWASMSGFGNYFESEAIKGALPLHRNSPQKAPFGLYPEQLSGSPFTAKRADNKRTWFYRLRPSVVTQASYEEDLSPKYWLTAPLNQGSLSPEPLRWDPLPQEASGGEFWQSLVTYAANGDVHARQGSAIHLFKVNKAMKRSIFANADGNLLILPHQGELLIKTECGYLQISPGEIAMIPRGMKFQLSPQGAEAHGYCAETYGNHWELPQLGPIGANGLANPRDFRVPVAHFEDSTEAFEGILKFGGRFWKSPLAHHPLDVVAWHGNYVPYAYNLRHFNTMGTVSYDHPDPSIFTVLSAPGVREGWADVDFVIFPARWLVAIDTFRPPYFHRNLMSEFMGLIYGVYDAKVQGGFVPGGASLHNAMCPHGPDLAAYTRATEADLKPEYLDQTLAFMFESSSIYVPSSFALGGPHRQRHYTQVWQNFPPARPGT